MRFAHAGFAFAALLLSGLFLSSLPGSAAGVAYQGQPSTTVTPDTAYSTAHYTFERFRSANKESITGYTITFPADTDAGGATAISPAGNVPITPPGQPVTVTFTTPVPERTTFSIILGGIKNPAANTYSAVEITLHWRNTQTGAIGSTTLPVGEYTIVPFPYISLTITTPGDGQSVEFGSIDPGVPTPAQQVTIDVDSSAPYTLTRSTGGASGLLGLDIAGEPDGLKPQGPATYTDSYTLTPPWTTDPSVPLTATVTYTVTQ